MPLMARKRTATLLYSTEEFLTVLEFFAVGDSPTAVLLRAVKGGDSLPQTKISAIFKVHLSLFLWLCFFIGHLTLFLDSSSSVHLFYIHIIRFLEYTHKLHLSYVSWAKCHKKNVSSSHPRIFIVLQGTHTLSQPAGVAVF